MGGIARSVTVLYGAVTAQAPPDEQDVLVEAGTVTEGLERLGYGAEPLALTLDLEAGRARLLQRRPPLVFNLVESLAGSGRLLHLAPALLEELALPYTGTPLTGLFLSSNKLIAKGMLTMAGIPTPLWQGPGADGRGMGFAAGPWIVKSVWEHASVGIDDDSLVTGRETLVRTLQGRRSRFGGDWFGERYIEGREFNLSLLAGPEGLEVLPPAEIRFRDFPPGKPKIVGYRAKWDPASFEYRHTRRCFAFPETEARLLAELRALALRCAALFQVRGYGRVDVRVDREGKPWVLEINANPCLAPDAGLMAAARQAGLGVEEVIGRIVADALNR